MKHSILILDFGSQYTQLIARRIREMGVYSEIYPFSTPLDRIKKLEPGGIILSGGPSSVLEIGAPMISSSLFELGIPILGICYGMQLIAYLMGGKVEASRNREYGKAELKIIHNDSRLLRGVKNSSIVWMSHGDSVIRLPKGFTRTAVTDQKNLSAIENSARNIYAVQFHPEVIHTEEGSLILSNFVFDICSLTKNWNIEDYVESVIDKLRNKYYDKKIVLGVSGGVDSTTLAVLMKRALGNAVTAVFINNGLLRLNEEKEVLYNLRERLELNVEYIDASSKFLKNLQRVKKPEQKRKIIGKTFIEVFWSVVQDFDYLAQGTLYPDVIETAPVHGPSRTIKTHHNRVAEVERLERQGRVIEPFRFLFKDEVREVGRILKIPPDILHRHPFPGPGLAVRILGEVTVERLNILRQADQIFIDTLKKTEWYDKIWQAFAVFLPVKSVGVMGDERAYGNVIALRAVTSIDGMTANRAELPYEVLDSAANQIIRQIREVNRVTYDITSKPPATIEWE